MSEIFGRKREINIINGLLKSASPEFLALYGRRRVGKTFLIKRFFQGKKLCFFSITGEKNAPMAQQIKHFSKEIGNTFYNGAELSAGKNWDETFETLTNAFKNIPASQKIILFFDEFPWMATQNSRLLNSLDYYWNQHWSNDKRIKLIICGSAASWIIDNIVNNKAGLHNRLTKQINLEPLGLSATKDFLSSNGVKLSNRHIVELYMCMGGVPYYLKQIEKGQSATQIIDSLAFNKGGLLLDEFNNLFSSLFKDSEIHEKIIKNIADSRYGIGKRELLEKTNKSLVGKGGLEKLKALKDAGFIIDFKPHMHKNNGVYYKLIDNYSLFYLYWISPIRDSLLVRSLPSGYWDKIKKSSSWYSWSGLAFEAICYEHLSEIMTALKLSPTSIPSTWRYVPKKNTTEQGAQIDLLFDRDDDAITICEIKYTDKPFVITKEYAEKLKRKLSVFKRVTRTKKQLFIAMICSSGIKQNIYSEALLSNVISLDDLFFI